MAAPLWWAWEEDGAGGSLLRPHPAPLPPSRLIIPKLRVPWGFPVGWGICARPMRRFQRHHAPRAPPARKGEQVGVWEGVPWVGHEAGPAQPLGGVRGAWGGGSRGRGGLPSPCRGAGAVHILYIFGDTSAPSVAGLCLCPCPCPSCLELSWDEEPSSHVLVPTHPSNPGGYMAPHQKVYYCYLAPRSVGLGGLEASGGAGSHRHLPVPFPEPSPSSVLGFLTPVWCYHWGFLWSLLPAEDPDTKSCQSSALHSPWPQFPWQRGSSSPGG